MWKLWKEDGFGTKGHLEGRKEDLVRRLEANLEDLLSLLVIKSLREDKVQKEKES